jgi:hypothetical protein
MIERIIQSNDHVALNTYVLQHDIRTRDWWIGHDIITQCVLYRRYKILETLLQYRPPSWNDVYPTVPVLHYAITTKNMTLIKLLLLFRVPTTGALFVAIDQPPVFTYLLEYCDPNERNKLKRTIAYWFTKAPQFKLMKLAVGAGLDLESCDTTGMTALWFHWQENNMQVVKMMLRLGADINRTFHGTSLIQHVMSTARHPSKVVFLLQNGARLPSSIIDATPQLRPVLFTYCLRLAMLGTSVSNDMVRTYF